MNSIIALLNKMDWFAGNKTILGVVLVAVAAAAEGVLGLFGMTEVASFADQAQTLGAGLFMLGVAADKARPV
mgnify:FL=1